MNRLDELVLIAVSKPLLTEFGIHHMLENCEALLCRLHVMTAFMRFGCV